MLASWAQAQPLHWLMREKAGPSPPFATNFSLKGRERVRDDNGQGKSRSLTTFGMKTGGPAWGLKREAGGETSARDGPRPLPFDAQGKRVKGEGNLRREFKKEVFD